MKRIIFTLLIIISCITPVYATLPVDINYDGIISSQELSSEILNHLQSEGPVPLELIDAAWMYWHWNGTPLSITDSSNKTIIFDYPVKRLVAYDGSTLETLRSLNSTGIVVGVSKNTFDEPVFFPEFQLTQGVGTVWSPDIEALMKTRPDTIILYATISPDSVKTIEDQVHAFDPSVRVLRLTFLNRNRIPKKSVNFLKLLEKNRKLKHFCNFMNQFCELSGQELGEFKRGTEKKSTLRDGMLTIQQHQAQDIMKKLPLQGGEISLLMHQIPTRL
jgi:iron complex transport system substrate-binding protein